MKNLFDEKYYENGKELGISGYSNYRWIPELTIPFCSKVLDFCEIKSKTKILDFGCSKGYSVKALRLLGHESYGTDISNYSIMNADPEVRNFVFLSEEYKELELKKVDWIFSKDVLEHVPYQKLDQIIEDFYRMTDNVFVIVPLGDGKKYHIPEYENDITHIIREPSSWWIEKFENHGFFVEKFTTKSEGMKDNWNHYKNGNGIFIFKKI